MRFARRRVVSPQGEASSQRQEDGQRFLKKSYENHTIKGSVSSSECPAYVGFQKQQLCQALRESPVVHGFSFELSAAAVAESIRTGGGRRQVGLAGCLAIKEARSGEFALVFGFSLESAARGLAASLRSF